MLNHPNVRHGVQIPQGHKDLLIEEAVTWASFAITHSRMKPETVWRKSLQSLAFCLEHQTRHFAVPTKLVGTKDRQEALRDLREAERPMGRRLGLHAGGELIAVSDEDRVLGYLQTKHASWLRPLVPFGVSVHLLAVTGTDSAHKLWGCNVAIAFVALAIGRMNSAGGDGASRFINEQSRGDIHLWRDSRGIAHADIPHAVQHSPTGIEWGYHGSGPADLALSTLRCFTDAEAAERLHQRFKEDVIATLPREGGLIRAAFVFSWLAAHCA